VDDERCEAGVGCAFGPACTDALGAPYTLVTSSHSMRITGATVMPTKPFPGRPYLSELGDE
jgi:hypothetical protein